MRRLEASNACGLYSLRLTKPLVLVGALSCECKCEQAMQRTVSLSLMGSSVRAFVCACVCVCVCVCVFVCTLDRCRSRRVKMLMKM